MNTDLRFTPFLGLLRREIQRFFKVIYQTLAAPLINTSLYLLIFGIGIGKEISNVHGHPYLAFLIPGLVMMTTLRNAVENSSGSIIVSKFCGELEDLRIVPLTQAQIAWANALASLLRGLLVALLTFIVGAGFYWLSLGHMIQIQQPLTLLIFLSMGGLSFAHLGLTIAMLSQSFEQVTAVTTFILLPLIYLGGVFFSLGHLHPFWQQISQFNPLFYMIDGVRYGILGASDVSIELAFTVTFSTWAICYFMAIYSLKNGSYHRW